MRPNRRKTKYSRKLEEAGRTPKPKTYRNVRNGKKAENADIGNLRRVYGWERSGFSDKLNWLDRFLAKYVGKSWNKARSKLLENLDRRTKDDLHLWTHINQYVKTKNEVERRLWYTRRYYIDERGILRRCKDLGLKTRRYHRKPTEENDNFKHGGYTYEKIKGIWYRTWSTKKIDTCRVLSLTTGEWMTEEKEVVTHHKKQLNRRELRDMSLKNG